MADYIACGNNVDLQTVLMSLFSVTADIAGTPTVAGLIRVVDVTIDRSEDALVCATNATFEDLFRQCIALADDGYPALRVGITDYADGAGLLSAWSCAAGNSWQDTMHKIFAMSTDGEMCIRIANIT